MKFQTSEASCLFASDRSPANKQLASVYLPWEHKCRLISNPAWTRYQHWSHSPELWPRGSGSGCCSLQRIGEKQNFEQSSVKIHRHKFLICIRGLPYIMSTKIWDFYTLSEKYIRFVRKFGAFFNTPPHPSVRTSYMEVP